MFLDKLTNSMSDKNNFAGEENFKVIEHFVSNGFFKRIVFDVKQAMLFADIGSSPRHIDKIKPPFQNFYLEFTIPIENIPLFQEAFPERNIIEFQLRAMGFNRQNENESVLTIFFDDKKTGKIFTIPIFVGNDNKRRIFYEDEDDPKFNPTTNKLLELFHWICFYMMAKSVHITEDVVTRQMRRQYERGKTPIPEPWHRVKHEPKVFKKSNSNGVGTEHRYRYDVVGHLRLIKSNGREYVVWIDDHQRGLQHDLYIPKTLVVEGGKEIAKKETLKYFNQPTLLK